jgi:eukaryotic-like serine/threonine-protein kinase
VFAAHSRVKNIQLHESLGSGAFGTVFRATDILLNRECAIKFVPNTNPAAFVAHLEGQVLQQCKHDNVVEVFSCDVYADGTAHFAGIEMEYMAEGSAEAAVRSRFLSTRTVSKLGIDVLFALEHTHRKGVLHRDIKPANIMLSTGGAKLTDFGLAKAANAAGTASGQGSPIYCAPEVFSSNSTNEQTDVFSIGMSLFQLYNQYTTDDFDKNITDVATIRNGKTVKVMGYRAYVPRKIRLICNRACAHRPSDRYKSTHELRQALERLQVSLDWCRNSNSSWLADDAGRTVEMRVEKHKLGYQNVWTSNGRRVNAKCSFHITEQGALAKQQALVYGTTF